METQFGFRGLSLDLIQSYLSNRSQYTKINNHQSYPSNVNCGVPQGSSLGPLLFLIYINDLPTASSFEAILFADDAFLTLSDKNLNSLQKRVNDELFKIDLWLRTNKLSLNYSKISFMIINKHPSTTFTGNFQISINSHTLKRESVVKYLGILIDQNLNWSAHTKQLSFQLSRYAGLLYRTRKFLGKETLSLIYYTLIYSRVQYGITIWGSAKKIINTTQ